MSWLDERPWIDMEERTTEAWMGGPPLGQTELRDHGHGC